MTVSRRAMLTSSLVSAAAAGAALVPGRAIAAPTVRKFPFPAGREFTVLVTGDAGTGTGTQRAVAAAAKKLFAKERLSLALGLGDNIYEEGPKSVNDIAFRDKFEQPNTGLDVPWLMALGNHDNSSVIGGDASWLERGNIEVGYHAVSPRWWMPSRYYSVPVPAVNPVAEFFVLDLNPLAAYIPALLGYWSPTGQYITEQRAWLRRALSTSTAKWKFVCNHFPYLNNGPHGSAGAYDGVPQAIPHANGTFIKEFFESEVLGRAQFALAGHDHSQQVLAPAAAARGTNLLISGAAAKTVGGKSHSVTPALYQDFASLGFMVLNVSPARIGLRAYTVDVPTATAKLAYRQQF
jgi:tartrate-resistant acid phosphatase type 5